MLAAPGRTTGKNAEHQELVGKYKCEMDELNNYFTKWVHEVKIPILVSELILENAKDVGMEFYKDYGKI